MCVPSQCGGPFNELINRLHLYQTLKRSYKYPIYVCTYVPSLCYGDWEFSALTYQERISIIGERTSKISV